jgi:acyl-CoA synthetase (AMP-forming)/AMP-acid ligase II
MDSVYESFRRSVDRYAAAAFLHIPAQATTGYADGPVDLSYGEAGERIERLRESYRRAGYGRGHRIALLLQNRAEFFLHWFALNGLGACVVPVNHEMTQEEQAWIIGHSEACLLLHLPDLRDRADALRPLLGNQVAFADTGLPGPLPSPPAPASGMQPTLLDECALLYTSGSTGMPKGCILTNEYFLLSGQRYVELGGLCAIEPGQDRLITPLPLVHMNAMACSTVAMVLAGGCIVQLDRFHPRSWWQSVRESRATIVHYLGVMPAMLLNLAEQESADGHDFSDRVRFAFGAGVNPKHHAAFEQRFGFPLIEAWGMTETGNYGAIIANEEPRHVGTCCFGRPPAHLEVKLVDEEGQVVPTGEPGELLVRHRGDNPQKGFFSGYLKNEAATAQAWEGGWFHTGDVVRRDENGAMYFVDRRKNVIRRSGENISALEVEAVLSEDPAVAMVVVCPVPDEIRGDEVMACVIPSARVSADKDTAQQIVQRALAGLAYYKVPAWISFHESLPLTPSEKPRRAEIKALAADALERGACHDLRHLKKRRDAESA